MHRKLLLFFLLVLFVLGFISFTIVNKKLLSKNKPAEAINLVTELPELEEGDLIFRKGRSLVSRIVLMNDSKTDYSHIGIVAFFEKHPYVIHAVPGEPNIEGEEVVKCETPEDFLSSDKASKFAVYRLIEDTGSYSTLAAHKALEYYHARLPFDKAMNFRTDDKLYCTELVWKAYLAAGINITHNRFHMISFSMLSDSLILPGHFIENKSFTQICP
ncbi:MAG: hypothetical protein K0B15_09635 [Lentimicrobium sp.]|nr:hypothetical protein [Lentimicrobium sp.]